MKKISGLSLILLLLIGISSSLSQNNNSLTKFTDPDQQKLKMLSNKYDVGSTYQPAAAGHFKGTTDFSLQLNIPLEEFAGITGIESDGDFIYATRWADAAIDKYTLEGTLVETFVIAGVTHIRDLAYDGNYFYGTDGSFVVYEMDLENKNLVSTFLAPHTLRGLAYDEEGDFFYGNDLSSPIFAFNRDGILVNQFNLGSFQGIYGLAYDNLSDGGPFLWGFSQIGATLVQYQLPEGTETGITFSVLDELGLTEGTAGGLALVEGIVPGTFSFLGVLQGESIFALEAGMTQTFTNDVGISSIVTPESELNLTSSEIVAVKVKNYGLVPQSDIPVTIKLDGIEIATEIVSYTVDPGEYVYYTFNQTIDLGNPGQTYILEICTFLEGDEFVENDCKTKEIIHLEPSYCIPYANCFFGDGFEDFILGDISNISSGCSQNGYGDFTNLSTPLFPGTLYDASFKTGYSNQYVTMWIDFNKNFEFEESEKVINDFNIVNPDVLVTTQFSIPSNVEEGVTRLRIRANWLSPVLDPCSDDSFGETEDYTVLIFDSNIENDIAVVSLDVNPVLESGGIIPKATVANLGLNSQSFPMTFTIDEFSSTIEVADLQSGDSIQVEFDSWIATSGTYTAEVCAELEGDQNVFNNCKSKEIGVLENINAFGFVNYDPNHELEDYLVAFDISDPSVLLPVGNLNIESFLTSMCWVNGNIYAVNAFGQLYLIDPNTATTTPVGSTDFLNGLAFDGQTLFGGTNTFLSAIDPLTGESTFVGSFNSQGGLMMTIATDAQGNLYGLDIEDDGFYSINKETGQASLIGTSSDDFFYQQDLAFDYSNNTAYLAGYTIPTFAGLFSVDVSTGSASFIQTFQNDIQITALTIPTDASILFPPSNLQAYVTGNDVQLTWSDDLLNNFIEFNVYRDGDLIGTTTETAFVDPAPGIGIYEYQVSTVYEDGESSLTDPVEVVVGNPSVSLDPAFFEEVLEAGDMVTRELTIFNTGNIDLDYSLDVEYIMQGKSGFAPESANQQLNYEEELQKRFGNNWQDILVTNQQLTNSPEAISGYCEPSSNCNLGDGIESFEFAEIANLNSGCSPDGFGDFTNLSASVTAGMTYEISFSSSYHNNVVNVWIDLNQDEIFSEDERLLTEFPLQTAGVVYSTQITIPFNSLNGETRLRVMGSWINSTLNPCMNTTFGETEDYTVIIGGNNPWLSIQPGAGTVVPGDSAVIEVTFNAEDLDQTTYEAMISVETNDTMNTVLSIPATLTVIEQSLSNFEPVWETPFNPMTIFVVSAQIDSIPLDLGDEIGIFDIDPNTGEEICVGAGLVTTPVTGQNILEIIVSMDDGSNPDTANGFIPGNSIIYKLWNPTMGEVSDVTVFYPTPGFDETFTPLGTAIVELNGNAMITQPMILEPGWNLVSSRATPLNLNMMTVFQPLINMNVLEKVIDQDGGSLVYIPYPEPDGKWVNSIGEMSISEGYYVKVNDFVETGMQGLPVGLPLEIPLDQGWNIMGYPSEYPADGLDVVQPLIEDQVLYKVIDDAGGLIQYVPFPEPNGQWINTIGEFSDGEGYYLKVDESASLTITGEQGGSTKSTLASAADPVFFDPVYENNPYMPMHVILMTNSFLNPGDEVGIFDGEVCVGASVYEAGSSDMSITVTSMDDPDTEEIDGFVQGNTIKVKVYSNGVFYDVVETEFMEGSETFAALESHMASLVGLPTSIADNSGNIEQLNLYPNPVNDQTIVSMISSDAGKVTLELLDLNGQQVMAFAQAELSIGINRISLDISSVDNGIYILKILSEGEETSVNYLKLVKR